MRNREFLSAQHPSPPLLVTACQFFHLGSHLRATRGSCVCRDFLFPFSHFLLTHHGWSQTEYSIHLIKVQSQVLKLSKDLQSWDFCETLGKTELFPVCRGSSQGLDPRVWKPAGEAGWREAELRDDERHFDPSDPSVTEASSVFYNGKSYAWYTWRLCDMLRQRPWSQSFLHIFSTYCLTKAVDICVGQIWNVAHPPTSSLKTLLIGNFGKETASVWLFLMQVTSSYSWKEKLTEVPLCGIWN